MILSKMWNTFLDTTPRQWGHAAQIAVADLFDPIFRMRIVSIGSLAVILSVLAHAGVFAVLAYGIHSKESSELVGEAYTVEFNTVAAKHADVDPVYDDNSDIVIPVPKKKKKTEAELLA